VIRYVIDATDPITVKVAARSVTAITHASGVELTCLGGSLWVTQHDETRDWTLDRGEMKVFSDSGVLLVTVSDTGPGSFTIHTKQPSARQSGSSKGVLQEGLAGLRKRWLR
jgi:hypothetical protein